MPSATITIPQACETTFNRDAFKEIVEKIPDTWFNASKTLKALIAAYAESRAKLPETPASDNGYKTTKASRQQKQEWLDTVNASAQDFYKNLDTIANEIDESGKQFPKGVEKALTEAYDVIADCHVTDEARDLDNGDHVLALCALLPRIFPKPSFFKRSYPVFSHAHMSNWMTTKLQDCSKAKVKTTDTADEPKTKGKGKAKTKATKPAETEKTAEKPAEKDADGDEAMSEAPIEGPGQVDGNEPVTTTLSVPTTPTPTVRMSAATPTTMSTTARLRSFLTGRLCARARPSRLRAWPRRPARSAPRAHVQARPLRHAR